MIRNRVSAKVAAGGNDSSLHRTLGLRTLGFLAGFDAVGFPDVFAASLYLPLEIISCCNAAPVSCFLRTYLGAKRRTPATNIQTAALGAGADLIRQIRK